MNMPGSILEAKVKGLLDVVETHRDRQCDELIEEANRLAHELVATTWREERERLHREILRVREQISQKLTAAEAQRQTRRRQQRQAEDQALLENACNALRRELAGRWQDAPARRAWSAQLVQQAAATLLGRRWTIQHPLHWPEVERAATARQVEACCGEPPQFEPDSRLEAGLRICSPGACIDGSVDGLLHDGSEIEAQLLAMCGCDAEGGA